MSGERIEEEHESYGLLSLSRTSGGDRALFGSSIVHSNAIRLAISRAKYARDLSHDWYFPTNELIEIAMSPSQFAEAITSLNCGSGVPCTIKYVACKAMASPPYKHVREMFRNEFKERAEDAASKLDEAIEAARVLVEKPTATKADRKEILNKLLSARQQIGANLPFVSHQFDAQMDRSETEAKAAIEAFITHAVTTAGLDAIRNGSAPLVALPGREEESRDA